MPDQGRQAILRSGAGAQVTVLGIAHQKSPPFQVPGDARDDPPEQGFELSRCRRRHAAESRSGGRQLIDPVALLQFLGNWKIPALTAPFVVTTLLFVLACARFGNLHSTGALPTAGLPKAAAVEGIVTASTIGEGLLTGLAQVFFQGNAITGVFFAAGLLMSSRAAGVAALLGSFAGLLVAWGLGAAEPAIRAGAFGFNPALTAIALGSGFFVLNIGSAAYGILAVIATAVVFAALSAALEPLGMPALTAPFVLVVWLFLLASPLFRRLQAGTGTW